MSKQLDVWWVDVKPELNRNIVIPLKASYCLAVQKPNTALVTIVFLSGMYSYISQVNISRRKAKETYYYKRDNPLKQTSLKYIKVMEAINI